MSQDSGSQPPHPFALVQDLAKQMITISSAVIVISGTFLKDIFTGDDLHLKWLLPAAWAAFGLCIIANIVVLSRLVSYLGWDQARAHGKPPLALVEWLLAWWFPRLRAHFEKPPTLYDVVLRYSSDFQWVAFLVGMSLFAAFVLVNF